MQPTSPNPSPQGAADEILEELRGHNNPDRLIVLLRHLTSAGSVPLIHFEEIASRVSDIAGWDAAYADILGRYQIRDGQRAIVNNLLSHVLTQQGHLVLDIGANDGGFTRAVQGHANVSKVIAFEPIRRLADQLSTEFRSHPKVRVEPMAIGEECGTAELRVVEAEPGLSSLLPLRRDYQYFGKDFDQNTQTLETVQVTTIDAYVRRHRLLDSYDRIALKVDTQGFEYPVLRGARETLSSGRVQSILIEVMAVDKYEGAKDYQEIFEFLHESRFRLFDLLPFYREIDGQFQGAHRGRLTEFDCLFVHESFQASARQRSAA